MPLPFCHSMPHLQSNENAILFRSLLLNYILRPPPNVHSQAIVPHCSQREINFLPASLAFNALQVYFAITLFYIYILLMFCICLICIFVLLEKETVAVSTLCEWFEGEQELFPLDINTVSQQNQPTATFDLVFVIGNKSLLYFNMTLKQIIY